MGSLRGQMTAVPASLIGPADRWMDPPAPAIRSSLKRLAPLSARSPAERIVRLAPVLDAWQDPASPVREAAERVLPGITGFSEEMIRFGFPLQCRRIASSAIAAMCRAGHPRLECPEPSVIVLAGNIPGLSLLDGVLSVVAGAPVALKLPSGEPATGLLLAGQLRGLSGEDAPPLEAFWWPGGDDTREPELFDWAQRLYASGSDEAIDAIRGRFRRTRGDRLGTFAGFGHRLSAGYIPEGGFPLEEACHRFAVDIAMWDQEGCLSPHVIFVTRSVDVESAAHLLAEALEHLDDRLPAGEMTFHRKLSIRRLRSEVQGRMLADPTIRMWPPGGVSGWRVVLDPKGPLRPSPLGRTVYVRRIAGDAELVEQLRIWDGKLQCLGVAADPGYLPHLTGPIGELGATRLCAAGMMQEPGPQWLGEETDRTGRKVCVVEAVTEGAWRRLMEERSE